MRNAPFLILIAVFSSACSSLSVPVLRHETAETLGSGKFRLRARVETSRLFPAPSDPFATYAVEQRGSIFQGALFGIEGAAGLFDKMDAQLSTFYVLGGAGWRIGSKYFIKTWKKISFAAQLGYGRYSGQGTVTYDTLVGSQDTGQTLSAFMLDMSMPVSYRFSPSAAVYSGLSIYRIGVNGSAGASYVSQSAFDLGTNLGLKLNFGRVEGDFEAAFVRVYDPFSDSERIIPYYGISVGMRF